MLFLKGTAHILLPFPPYYSALLQHQRQTRVFFATVFLLRHACGIVQIDKARNKPLCAKAAKLFQNLICHIMTDALVMSLKCVIEQVRKTRNGLSGNIFKDKAVPFCENNRASGKFKRILNTAILVLDENRRIFFLCSHFFTP
nr:MAG TPA: hypothetical protein [Caudoviricetes sp.]